MGKTIKIPGMLDPHVHLRGMDWVHKGTFASETAAALAGGYWAVFDMPNTPPETTSPETLEAKRADLDAQALCDWGVYYGASQHENTVTYPQVVDSVCGLKIYNNATTGSLLIEEQSLRANIYRTWPRTSRIAVHAEGETVRDILALVRAYHVPTHFCHISTAAEIEYLRAAKVEGLPVTVGVTPHHLFLTEADVLALGALGQMKPELKTSDDRDALWDAIEFGVVDVVESDHAPHTLDEKTSGMPPSGVPGLETTLPLLCTAVHDERLTEARMIELVALRPQRIFAVEPPRETYTIVEMDVPHVIDSKNLRTLCGWSPFNGMSVMGKVREVWIRGQKVFDGEQVLVEPGFGQDVYRGAS